MVDRARRWHVTRSPRYLRLAIPGLVLVLLSGDFWGQGWWPYLALLLGLALIRLPLPTTPKKRDIPTEPPQPPPGNWTGTR
ncbi:MAG TPA: hypothetical protein VJN29_10935 [Intrasporangium sp.]|uniref:hypothetical protein n=1 Tax=Intrasporangium sp. TaxID=1925024 RepID=UPI002B4829F8|nr:hypothetical protein [Intrasporangium sp.]HKX67729.1 hypothetical protein [Intrasporangium sp.]